MIENTSTNSDAPEATWQLYDASEVYPWDAPPPGCEDQDDDHDDYHRAAMDGVKIYASPDIPEVREHNRAACQQWKADRVAAREKFLASLASDKRKRTRVEKWVAAVFVGVINDVATVQSSRNTRLRWAARRLGELSHGGLDETRCKDKLMEASAPWDYNEAGRRQSRATIKSGWNKGIATPADIDAEIARSSAKKAKQPIRAQTRKGSNANMVDESGDDAGQNDETNASLQDIEDGFWDARDSLKTIYKASLSRMASPWAALAVSAARALAHVRPNVTLPPLIGGRGSLNWFGAIVASPGGGKGAAQAVARDLVREFVYTRNLGSGEGLVDAYHSKASDENPDGIRESVMFVANEIDTLAALATRNGSNLLPSLRMGFMGEELGFTYRSNDAHVNAHGYRMTLILATQPEKAGWLLGDQHGGTPQRFMWFPSTDDRISIDRPYWDGEPLAIPQPQSWLYPVDLQIPKHAEQLILGEHVKRQRGQQDALDGHALFVREKFAFALAVLDGRDRMTGEDWDLAGIAMQVSDHIRAQVAKAVELASEQEATQRGTLQGVSAAAANVSKAQQEWKRTRRIENWIIGKLKAAGATGLSEGELKRTAHSPDRHSIKPVLDTLADQGVVKPVEQLKDDRTERWTLAE